MWVDFWVVGGGRVELTYILPCCSLLCPGGGGGGAAEQEGGGTKIAGAGGGSETEERLVEVSIETRGNGFVCLIVCIFRKKNSKKKNLFQFFFHI